MINDQKNDSTFLLSKSLSDFIDHRNLMGYKTNIYERHLKQFYNYCTENNITINNLTEKQLTEYCYSKFNESEQTKRKRMTMMIHYARHLRRHDFEINIPKHRNNVVRTCHNDPHIYTKQELKSFFRVVDNWKLSKYANTNRTDMDPLLFRLYYGCGLRLNEPLKLKLKDVDLKNGVLYINNGKNNRSRIIPISNSVRRLFILYCDKCLPGANEKTYLFPSSKQERPISGRLVYGRFREYLAKAGIKHTGHGPRIHDFRHTYCIHRLKKWVLEGVDLNTMLPYLSAYLGHVDFRGTEYYLRLTADLYPQLINQMENYQSSVIPQIKEQSK
ncbi:MAG: tyrosine-type recombinase/integrase [Tenericutes bacterium]|jgi:integrase/recombinase XerD|nr:tyrosine-type recombinase/integrase [Mycoplasmatota bacterium]